MRSIRTNPLISAVILCMFAFSAAVLLIALVPSQNILHVLDAFSGNRTITVIAFGAVTAFLLILVFLTVYPALRRASARDRRPGALSEKPAVIRQGSARAQPAPQDNDHASAAHLLADILRAMPCAMLITDREGAVQVCYNCESFAAVDNPVGHRVAEVFPPDMLNAVKLRKTIEAVLTGQTRRLDNLTVPGGGHICYDLVAAPLGPADALYGTILVLEDATARWELNRKLAESRDFLKNIIYRSPSSMCVFGKDGAAIMANDAYLELFRAERAAVVGHYNIFKDAAYKERGFFPDIQKAFAGSVVALPPATINLPAAGYAVSKGGQSVTIQGVLLPLFGPGGDVSNVIMIHQDLTDLTRAETEVRYLSEYNRRILDSMGAGVRVIDAGLGVEYSNDYMRDSIEKKSSGRCYDFLGGDGPCEPCVVNRAITEGRVVQQEYTAADGRVFSYVAAPITGRDGKTCAVSVIRDTTENRRLQQQMLQQEKLSTLGMLAGGIAHEINNPLGVIAMYSQMLGECRDNPEEMGKHIDVINRNVENCRNIIQGLLTFARKQPLRKQPIDINACVRDAVALCRRLVRKTDIALNEELDENGLPLLGDAIQLQQVFVNLITNAVQAMPDG
ncbi:MAG: histidine kinase dimerization/phospho-acceptor domain-containing protein, partial [Planctomycetota bacterium]